MIEVDGLIIRNALEQIEKNKDDITEIKQGLGDALPNPIPGPKGPKGDVGSIIKTGHGLPYFTPAAEEQIYWIDLDTGKWYQYNKDLGWTVTAELKGKEGKQGKQGLQGLQGKPGLGIDTLNSINIGDNGAADVIYQDGVAHIENTGSLTYNVKDSKPVNTVLELPIKGDNKIAVDASADGASVEIKIDETGATEGQVLGIVNNELAWKSLPELPTLAPVATSGSYNDLTDKPTLAAVATSGEYRDLKNLPDLKQVAVTGNYIDLINKPTIPEVGEGTITLKQGDTIKGYFNVNDKTDKTIELDAGGGTIDPSNLAQLVPSETDLNHNTFWSPDHSMGLQMKFSKEQTSYPNRRPFYNKQFIFKVSGYYSGLLVTIDNYPKGGTWSNQEINNGMLYGYRSVKKFTSVARDAYDEFYFPEQSKLNSSVSHTICTDKTLKTLFGNQSIYTNDGKGNIDLYKHHITVNGYGADFYGDFYSSKSLLCDSLTDLKTILGNSFKLAMYGAANTGALGSGWYLAMYLDENALHLAGYNGTNSIQYTNLTITDEITTI